MIKPLRTIIPNQKGLTPRDGKEKEFAAIHKGGPLTAASEEEINVMAVDFDEEDNSDLHQAIVEANSELNEEDHERWMHSDAFINHSQHAVEANRKASNSLMHSNKELDPLLRDHHAELHQIYKKAATKHLKIAAYHAKKCGMKEGVDYIETVSNFAALIRGVDLNEVSTNTLASYISKASDAQGHRKLPMKKVDNRYAGVSLADKKLNKKIEPAKYSPRKEETNLSEKNWIAGAIKHPGVEKAAAKRAGESTHEYMVQHKNSPGTAGRRARLGLTLSKMNKG